MSPALPCETLLGDSPAAKSLRSRVSEIAHLDCPVLLLGERGTGRELVARVLHSHSARHAAGFVRIDSTFYERERLEEKLRRAAGGTLLIKEIGAVGPDPQRALAELLRRQRHDEHSVRVLGSTGCDLGLAVDAGLFDAEVYQRLGARRIDIPALRERLEDVPVFAEHFLRESRMMLGREPLGFSPRALERLSAYSWPGNVAELRDTVWRLSLRARYPIIDVSDIEVVLPPVHQVVPLEQLSFEDMVRSKLRAFLQRMEGYPIKDLYDEVIARVERPLIEEVLERTAGNQMKAAEMLGMNRNTLRKKMLAREIAFPGARRR